MGEVSRPPCKFLSPWVLLTHLVAHQVQLASSAPHSSVWLPRPPFSQTAHFCSPSAFCAAPAPRFVAIAPNLVYLRPQLKHQPSLWRFPECPPNSFTSSFLALSLFLVPGTFCPVAGLFLSIPMDLPAPCSQGRAFIPLSTCHKE